jgi:hypothetical protein
VTTEDERITAWWAGLSGGEREEIRGILADPLPEHVVRGLLDARVTVTGAVGRAGMTYRLPPAVRVHIEKSADAPLET